MGDQGDSRPIFSSRANEPALADAIEAFVVELAERIDHLQDAQTRQDFEQLGSLARQLAGDSERLGYAYLASCARVLEAACLAEDGGAVHKSVLEVTHIGQRVRLGHRGSN